MGQAGAQKCCRVGRTTAMLTRAAVLQRGRTGQSTARRAPGRIRQFQHLVIPGTGQLQQPVTPSRGQLQQPVTPSTVQFQQPIIPGTGQFQQPVIPGTGKFQQP
eukprot:207931-Chlamydomonas_euryale.AAC.1